MANLAGQRTLTQLEGDIAAILGDGFTFSTTSYPTQSMADQIINRWYKRLWNSRPWRFTQQTSTITTTAGVINYVLPDDCREIISIRIPGLAMPVRFVAREKFTQTFPGAWVTDGSAMPTIWMDGAEASNNARTIDLWQKPDSTYSLTLEYRAGFTPLTTGTDVSKLYPELEDYIVYGPASEILMMLGDQRSEYYKQEAAIIKQDAWTVDERVLDGMNSERAANEVYGPLPWTPFIGT